MTRLEQHNADVRRQMSRDNGIAAVRALCVTMATALAVIAAIFIFR